ncbi:hypothetical protein J8655_14325 [Dickeya oryzae]|nr:hypothetical protein [Dickeya oryzae]
MITLVPVMQAPDTRYISLLNADSCHVPRLNVLFGFCSLYRDAIPILMCYPKRCPRDRHLHRLTDSQGADHQMRPYCAGFAGIGNHNAAGGKLLRGFVESVEIQVMRLRDTLYYCCWM